MSTNPERAISYVLNKYVTKYMDKDVLILDQKHIYKGGSQNATTL